MDLSDDVLKSSYSACRRLVRQSGSNFARCLFLLPPTKRRAMSALYAFLRITDDLIDQPVPAPQRRQVLRQWAGMLDQMLQQAAIPFFPPLETEELVSQEFLAQRRLFGEGLRTKVYVPPMEAADMAPAPGGSWLARPEDFDGQIGPDRLAILPALVHTVREFHIPPVYLYAVLEGVGMDLETIRYATFEQLSGYCRRVASAVGLACLCIWGSHCPEAATPAIACGLAFQLTNILRDLKEDAQMGRVYVPTEDLAAVGYSVEDFPPAEADERFDRLIRREVERAQGFYRQAADLWEYLDRPDRRIFGMMYETYRRLLDRIAQKPRIVLAARVRLTGWEKLSLALRWTLWPSPHWLLGSL